MVSNFQILGIMYRLLNISAVTSAINGKIYKWDVPSSSQKEDIEIVVTENQGDYIQYGNLHVRVYVPEIKEKVPDAVKFNNLAGILIPLLDGVQVEELNLQILNQSGPQIDRTTGRDGMFFIDFKMGFEIL